ncbi:hypothetical protein [Rodentibacter caecimuris]|uniref:C-type lysozyme inhibitor domain-containing protein n=1 Tax=Rodentibacter caecimuris TaxID=1796644 RepID=A0ABX3KX52_9PAST|nr:hypothetical protein BKG89_06965 [Rodentibacter heylii]
MKFVKFVPALVASVVLTACSTASDVVSSTADAVTKTTETVVDNVSKTAKKVSDKLNMSTKSVVYQCQNKTVVSAAYVFEGKSATSVTLMVGKQPIGNLALDENAPNPMTFASKDYRWHTDESFSLENFDKSSSVMLFKIGKDSDEILAKNCKINVSETKILNKTN